MRWRRYSADPTPRKQGAEAQGAVHLRLHAAAGIVGLALSEEVGAAGHGLDDRHEAPERGLRVAALEQQPRRQHHPLGVPAPRRTPPGVGGEHGHELLSCSDGVEFRVARAREVEPDEVVRARRRLIDHADQLSIVAGRLRLPERLHAEQSGPGLRAGREATPGEQQPKIEVVVVEWGHGQSPAGPRGA